LIPPWSDPHLHQHTSAEEFYLLRQGQLSLVIKDFRINLQPNELLMIRPAIPHSVVGGKGKIEHFGIRAPGIDDKQILGELTSDLPLQGESERMISGDWGHRIPLDAPQHKNCWLIGAGSALYESQYLTMAYLDFLTYEAANAGIGTRHQLHSHQYSWEYYTVLQGVKVLLIEGEQVPIYAGDILVVPPNVKHTLYSRQAPYQGFTIRVPVGWGDKVVYSG
jgi:mannose-6-phosphate isomerase-like protein (cupin superfamily)